MATPLEYISPKFPGLGDVNWAKYVSASHSYRLYGLGMHRGRG